MKTCFGCGKLLIRSDFVGSRYYCKNFMPDNRDEEPSAKVGEWKAAGFGIDIPFRKRDDCWVDRHT